MSETKTEATRWIDVADAGDVPDGEVRTFEAAGHRVAVARSENHLYAVQDLCSHDDGPLGDGELEQYAIVCPRHGAKFDVRTGEVLMMPAVAPIDTFPVKEEDGRIHIVYTTNNRTTIMHAVLDEQQILNP